VSEFYVGLISGTSVDAVDAALVDFSATTPQLRAVHSHTIAADLRDELLALTTPGADELERMARADVAVGRLFADAAQTLLRQAGCPASAVRALGSHGQTLRHLPSSAFPTTIQVGDPNIIAQLTGITTVADFRRRDMAAGGQGAPLAPALHATILRSPSVTRAVVNIGGIANTTILPRDAAAAVVGFDTGPGNGLLDAWAGKHGHGTWDERGQWASSGKFRKDLFEALIDDPYIAQPAPKSTGREYFNLNWLHDKLAQRSPLPAVDVQRTLCEFTAVSIAGATLNAATDVGEVLVCGGGIHNSFLMKRLQAAFADVPVRSTAEFGVDPDWVEAIAFAWLARQTIEGKPGNVPSVTGASEAVVLGGIYRGSVT
jgi:anhydro-N-acetylmuramic acid kinase